VIDAVATAPTVREVPEPQCPATGVVVRVDATGVCRSDWHAWMGHDPVALPHVPGHELAGVVLRSPDPGTQARQLLDRGFRSLR